MRALLITYCSFFSCLLQGQEKPGVFTGEINTDSVTIKTIFTFKTDSTYKIYLNSSFKQFCTGKDTSTWIFEGQWRSEGDWIFLYPFNKGIGIFYQYLKRSRKDKKVINKYRKENFLALKITNETDQCQRIYFRIDAECFKDIWKYYYVEKQCR